MEAYTDKREVTLRDFLTVVFRRKALIITTCLVVLITVYVILQLRTPIYEAQVKVLVQGQKQVESPYYTGFYGDSMMINMTQNEIVRSNFVIERAVRALGLDRLPLDYEKNFATHLKTFLIEQETKRFKKQLENLSPEQKQTLLFRRAVDRVKSNLKVEPVKDTNTFIISVFDYHPVGAAIIANVVSRSYIIFDLEQQLAELQLKYGEKHPIARQIRNYIDDMQKNLNGKPISGIDAIGPATVKIIEQARVPLEPVQHFTFNKKFIFLAAFIMSVFLGVLIAALFEFLDPTFKSQHDIETYLNIPFLGSVPKRKRRRKSKASLLIEDINITTDDAKSYQHLSEQMFLLLKNKNFKSVLITDAEDSEVTPVIIANLGIYLSNKAGDGVLIIDANLRTPLISKIFDIPNTPGLADVIEGKVSFDSAIHQLGTNLTVLPSGNTVFNPSTLLDSSIMSDLVKAAREKYGIVLLACAGLRNFADAVMLSYYTDGVAMVISERRLRRLIIKNAIMPLEEKKTNLIGVIMSNRTFPIPKFIYKWM